MGVRLRAPGATRLFPIFDKPICSIYVQGENSFMFNLHAGVYAARIRP